MLDVVFATIQTQTTSIAITVTVTVTVTHTDIDVQRMIGGIQNGVLHAMSTPIEPKAVSTVVLQGMTGCVIRWQNTAIIIDSLFTIITTATTKHHVFLLFVSSFLIGSGSVGFSLSRSTVLPVFVL
jgi:hypothetical protein